MRLGKPTATHRRNARAFTIGLATLLGLLIALSLAAPAAAQARKSTLPPMGAASTATPSTATPNPPAAPAASATDLITRNAGDVTVTLHGSVATATIAKAKPGETVWLYVYSATGRPTPVNGQKLDDKRQARVDLMLLPAGGHKIAVLDAKGELLGWSATQLPSKDSHAAPTAAQKTAAANDAALAWPWWTAAGIVLLLLALAAILLRRRTRPRDPDPTDDHDPTNESAAEPERVGSAS